MGAETGALRAADYRRTGTSSEFRKWLLTRCTHFPKESRYMFMEPEAECCF
jgi:hypothetical protein